MQKTQAQKNLADIKQKKIRNYSEKFYHSLFLLRNYYWIAGWNRKGKELRLLTSNSRIDSCDSLLSLVR